MSHFTVAVFTDGKKSMDELLAPFDENLETNPYVSKTKQQLIDEAKQRKADYLERRNKGEAIADWMQQYINANADDEFYACEFDEDCQYDADGNELSTYNPNSKWDWYSVGGRWSGLLKAKTGERGTGGLFTPVCTGNGKFDSAKVSDIDFSPDKNQYKKSLRWWEVVIEGSPLKNGEDESNFHNFYKKEYLINKYKDKETYATIQSTFSTFSVITPDGKWYEKGKMGWWACVSNEEDEWDLKYKERFIDTANPNWVLTIVDCHI